MIDIDLEVAMQQKPPYIFISYRRDDARGEAGRIFDRLVAKYGPSQVFRDTTIPPGSDFRKALEDALEKCDIFLAVIGKRWRGGRRIDQDDDILRQEVGTVLRRRDVRVIPILIEETPIPKPEKLPAEIAGLASRQAARVRDASFDQDIATLIEKIDQRHELSREATYVLRHMHLSNSPAGELMEAKDVLDGMLKTDQNDFEARLLQDQLVQSIVEQYGKEDIQKHRRARTRRLLLWPALAGLFFAVGVLAYLGRNWDVDFRIQDATKIEGVELDPGTERMTENFRQCADLCLRVRDCAAFSFEISRSAAPKACVLVRAPLHSRLDPDWISGKRR